MPHVQGLITICQRITNATGASTEVAIPSPMVGQTTCTLHLQITSNDGTPVVNVLGRGRRTNGATAGTAQALVGIPNSEPIEPTNFHTNYITDMNYDGTLDDQIIFGIPLMPFMSIDIAANAGGLSILAVLMAH